MYSTSDMALGFSLIPTKCQNSGCQPLKKLTTLYYCPGFPAPVFMDFLGFNYSHSLFVAVTNFTLLFNFPVNGASPRILLALNKIFLWPLNAPIATWATLWH